MSLIAEFTVHYSQFLDPNGEITQTLPAFASNPDELITLYRWMVLTRTFDTKAINLQRTGKMGTYASSLGQEAVSVGIGRAMQADDVLAPAYREYGAQFQRGVTMQEILAYWGGDERGNDFGNAEDLPLCVPIATQCLHAAGVAKAFKLRQQPRAVVTVCGDGATSQGDFYEAMNVAGVWNLPVVFVVSNNQWAISVPRSIQSQAQTLAQKAIAAGFDGEQIDGNDIIAVKHTVENALKKARNGNGPTLIEAMTYRLSDHTTADDATRYRSKEEVEEALKKEPITRLKHYLMKQNHWNDTQEQQLIDACRKDVEAAVTDYMNTPKQAPEAMFDTLYATLPDALVEQRETAIANHQEDPHHA